METQSLKATNKESIPTNQANIEFNQHENEAFISSMAAGFDICRKRFGVHQLGVQGPWFNGKFQWAIWMHGGVRINVVCWYYYYQMDGMHARFVRPLQCWKLTTLAAFDHVIITLKMTTHPLVHTQPNSTYYIYISPQ